MTFNGGSMRPKTARKPLNVVFSIGQMPPPEQFLSVVLRSILPRLPPLRPPFLAYSLPCFAWGVFFDFSRCNPHDMDGIGDHIGGALLASGASGHVLEPAQVHWG